MVLDKRRADVARIVAKAVEDARATTSRHTVALESPPELYAKLDTLRFEQVLSNLLDNAIKFSPAGGRIDVGLSSPERGTVRLVVRDHGIGIAPQDRAHVFERFYQSQPNDQ